MNFIYTYGALNIHSEEVNLSYLKYRLRTQNYPKGRVTSINFTDEETRPQSRLTCLTSQGSIYLGNLAQSHISLTNS